MMELPYLDEKRLQTIGIPLGPRIRIMKEAQKSSYVWPALNQMNSYDACQKEGQMEKEK